MTSESRNPSLPASPTVVAVIVHHRGRDMLDLAVRSLLASERVDLDVVVVSNHCLEPLPAIVGDHPRAHVVETGEPVGFSEANNRGVAFAVEQLAPAEYYYFVNNDTESLPTTLAALTDGLAIRPDAAMAGPQTRILGHREHLNSLGINVTEDAWGWDEGIGLHLDEYGTLPSTRPVLAVTGSALLVERLAFDKVGGWTELYEWYFEDIDLALKLWKAGREVIVVPEAVIYHQISATMTTGAERKFFFMQRNRLYLAMVHWPRDLLFALLKRAWFDEIVKPPRVHTRIARRAFYATLRRLPKLLRARRQLRGDTAWRRFLHPAGSVPVITLPADAEATSPVDRDEDPFFALQRDLPQRPPPPPEAWAPLASLAPRADGRRLLVVGWSPLPFEAARIHYAPGKRTWQLARALADAGHAVCVVASPIPGSRDEPENGVESIERDGVVAFTVTERHFHAAGLAGLVDTFDPDALVGAAPVPSRLAVRMAGSRPVWVDLFGDPMAEAQARATVVDADDVVGAYSEMLAHLLYRGDAFSVVSERQRWAAIGQLGLGGRLNRETAGRELVHVLPCHAPEVDETPEDASAPGDDAFTILWSGSFNTWCDVETLVDGLEQAMDDEPRLHFVATGGSVEGHDEVTAERLRQRVSASRHRERFALLGRLPKDEAEAVWRRADLGVLTEKAIAERQLGSSGRLAGWLARGLPFVATDLSELGGQAANAGAAWIYPAGDASALAACLIEAAADPEGLAERGRRARALAVDELSIAATTRPLVAWAAVPERAADARSLGRPELIPGAPFYQAIDERDAARDRADLAEAGYHEIRGELGKIHQSTMWAVWMWLYDLRALPSRLLGRGRRSDQSSR